MTILIAILLGTLALAFVLYPLYHGIKSRTSPAPDELPTVQQTDREQAARSALQEVEFDYQLGNLAEDDYRTLRQRYMRRALTALKTRHDREHAIDEMIEQQLRQLRKEHENGLS